MASQRTLPTPEREYGLFAQSVARGNEDRTLLTVVVRRKGKTTHTVNVLAARSVIAARTFEVAPGRVLTTTLSAASPEGWDRATDPHVSKKEASAVYINEPRQRRLYIDFGNLLEG